MVYRELNIPVEKFVEPSCRSLITVDGLWFLAVEEAYGLDTAIKLDTRVWEMFMPIHTRRLAKIYGLPDKGITALIKVIEADPVWTPFKPVILKSTDKEGLFRFTDCPPQRARIREGRGEFPCKPVGIACFESALATFAPEAKLRCVVCPPDPHPQDVWCEWEFRV